MDVELWIMDVDCGLWIVDSGIKWVGGVDTIVADAVQSTRSFAKEGE